MTKEELDIIEHATGRNYSPRHVRTLSVLQTFGAGKPKRILAPQWPEPRPIEEAPNTAILAWCPATEELTEGWEVVYPSNQPGWWCGNGELHQPTHFLPLPPKPEVRK